MAIQKSKTLPNGVTGDYWRITQVSIVSTNMTFNVTISLFLSQAAFMAGAKPLTSNKIYRLTFTGPDLVGDIIATTYGKVKAQASATVTRSITGAILSPPGVYDPDLDGGTDV